MPQLSMPIFDGGRRTANLDLATLRRDSAVVAYEQAVQDAFREAADALAATDKLEREQSARDDLAQSSTESVRLSELRYRQGVGSHLRYLDAQRRNFADRSSLIEIATERQLAVSSLFKALGGGWQMQADDAEALATRRSSGGNRFGLDAFRSPRLLGQCELCDFRWDAKADGKAHPETRPVADVELHVVNPVATRQVAFVGWSEQWLHADDHSSMRVA